LVEGGSLGEDLSSRQETCQKSKTMFGEPKTIVNVGRASGGGGPSDAVGQRFLGRGCGEPVCLFFSRAVKWLSAKVNFLLLNSRNECGGFRVNVLLIGAPNWKKKPLRIVSPGDSDSAGVFFP